MKWIFTSLAPNMERDDLFRGLSLLVQPWKWKRGSAIGALEKRYSEYFGGDAFSFASGRTALYAILKSLHLEAGDEVLLQAYTCVAVPDPVLWAKLKPVYVDCDQTLTMSAESLEKKLTHRSKVLIIQHTFGASADIEGLIKIARANGLVVIEDCAHAVGATHHDKRLGTFGDAAFFSFGRDKALSSVFGGIAVSHHEKITEGLRRIHHSFAYPEYGWVLQQLLHLPVLSLSKSLYGIASLGKLVLTVCKRLQIISKAVYAQERHGGAPHFVFRKMPNALAQLALHQFAKLEKFNNHRRHIAALYRKELPASSGFETPPLLDNGAVLLRYTLKNSRAHELIRRARSRQIELGDWYSTVLAPSGVRYGAVHYEKGSCPVAEELSRTTFNLPTHIGITDADVARIAQFLKSA